MEKENLERLQKLEKQYRHLKGFFVFFVAATMVGIFMLSFSTTANFGVIRAKGIVIEDENGKDRILIGAPIPFSKDRVRTDTALVKKLFAKTIIPKNPDLYMKYYSEYSHSATGMVVLNDKGIDVVQYGDKLSDPNTGKRQFAISGLIWNAQNGTELGGIGINTLANGKSRGVFGFDDPSDGGSEALHGGVLEDGSRFLILRDNEGSFVMGMGKPKNPFFQNNDTSTFVGMRYFDKKGTKIWEQQMNKQNTKNN